MQQQTAGKQLHAGLRAQLDLLEATALGCVCPIAVSYFTGQPATVLIIYGLSCSSSTGACANPDQRQHQTARLPATGCTQAAAASACTRLVAGATVPTRPLLAHLALD